MYKFSEYIREAGSGLKVKHPQGISLESDAREPIGCLVGMPLWFLFPHPDLSSPG